MTWWFIYYSLAVFTCRQSVLITLLFIEMTSLIVVCSDRYISRFVWLSESCVLCGCSLPINLPYPVILTWAFLRSHSAGSNVTTDYARIYQINVTNTVSGGAASCRPCPRGGIQHDRSDSRLTIVSFILWNFYDDLRSPVVKIWRRNHLLWYCSALCTGTAVRCVSSLLPPLHFVSKNAPTLKRYSSKL